MKATYLNHLRNTEGNTKDEEIPVPSRRRSVLVRVGELKSKLFQRRSGDGGTASDLPPPSYTNRMLPIRLITHPIHEYDSYRPGSTSNAVHNYPGYRPDSTTQAVQAYVGYRSDSTTQVVHGDVGFRPESTTQVVQGYVGFRPDSTTQVVHGYVGFRPESTTPALHTDMAFRPSSTTHAVHAVAACSHDSTTHAVQSHENHRAEMMSHHSPYPGHDWINRPVYPDPYGREQMIEPSAIDTLGATSRYDISGDSSTNFSTEGPEKDITAHDFVVAQKVQDFEYNDIFLHTLQLTNPKTNADSYHSYISQRAATASLALTQKVTQLKSRPPKNTSIPGIVDQFIHSQLLSLEKCLEQVESYAVPATDELLWTKQTMTISAIQSVQSHAGKLANGPMRL
jgi:hypothetical protein